MKFRNGYNDTYTTDPGPEATAAAREPGSLPVTRSAQSANLSCDRNE
jgi:hypothetical protein